MPCSLESNVWLSVFCEHDHDGGEEHDNASHPSRSASARHHPTNTSGRLIDETEDPDPWNDWPLAGIFTVLPSEASEFVKQAKSKGLHTRIVPKSVRPRIWDRQSKMERNSRWAIVLGTDPAAVDRLFEMRFRAGQSVTDAQAVRSVDRSMLWLVIAGAMGGLAIWRLLCL
jgi:hypothetical protein